MKCTNVSSASKWNWIQAHAKSVEALSAKIVYRTAKTAHNAEDWRARSNQMQYWKSLLHKASNHASISKQAWLALANGLSVLTAPTPVGNEGGVSARREESVRECIRKQGPLLL